jgi:hypothetical protein
MGACSNVREEEIWAVSGAVENRRGPRPFIDAGGLDEAGQRRPVVSFEGRY